MYSLTLGCTHKVRRPIFAKHRGRGAACVQNPSLYSASLDIDLPFYHLSFLLPLLSFPSFFFFISSFPFLFLPFWRPFSDPGGRDPGPPKPPKICPWCHRGFKVELNLAAYRCPRSPIRYPVYFSIEMQETIT